MTGRGLVWAKCCVQGVVRVSRYACRLNYIYIYYICNIFTKATIKVI